MRMGGHKGGKEERLGDACVTPGRRAWTRATRITAGPLASAHRLRQRQATIMTTQFDGIFRGLSPDVGSAS